jgi:hypothetical protein
MSFYYEPHVTVYYNEDAKKKSYGEIWYRTIPKWSTSGISYHTCLARKFDLISLCCDKIANMILNKEKIEIRNLPTECYDNIQKLITLKQISDIDRNNGFRKYSENYDIYSYKWVIFYTDDYYPNKRLIYHQYKRGKIRMKYDDIIAVRIILEKKERISYKFLFYIFALIILVTLIILIILIVLLI